MTPLNSKFLVKDAIAAAVDEGLNPQDVDLTNCDREPIHIPNAIQPHGMLMVIATSDLTLLQVSENIIETLDLTPDKVLGQSIATILTADSTQSLQQYLTAELPLSAPLSLQFANDCDRRRFSTTIHQQYDRVIIELEPVDPESDLSFFQFFQTIKAPIERLQQTETLAQLCQVAVQEVRRLTGFDRVMVYQFHSDGSGSVIAEAVDDRSLPYLGLRYPATDIPKQARSLYTLNWLRMIPTIDYTPVPLVPAINPPSGQPLDLSQTVLRSVSPIHLEYLANMGVRASMSISLIRDRQLWGLIACHHEQPKYVNFAVRQCCEFFGQIISAELNDKQQNDTLEYRLKLKSLLSELSQSIASADFLLEGLLASPQQLMDLANAQGVALIDRGKINSIGISPTEAEIQALLPTIESQLTDTAIYHTVTLSELEPTAINLKDRACGLLALSISRSHQIYLLWFRPELVHTIDWAGNPDKPQEVGADGTVYLSPRQSFARWSQTVYLQSAPWLAQELAAVLELRSNIIGIVLQKADELAAVNLELFRSNEDLSAFAYVASHDLKAPLRAIANLACWLQEDLSGQLSPEHQSHLDTIQSRVYRMDELIDGLLEYAKSDRQNLTLQSVNLTSLLTNIVDLISAPTTVEIVFPRQHLVITTYQVLLQQVLSNLIDNAIKYIARPDGKIEITVEEQADWLRFEVRDNGPGIEPEYHQKIFEIFQTLETRDRFESTGIGLAIVKKIVEGQGGKVVVSSNLGEGCTFSFTWPKSRST